MQFIINSLSKTFDDAYAFNEISKNPHNPNFSENYYKKINIQNLLKEINTKNINLYNFYQNLKRAFCELEDIHINLDLTRFLYDFTKVYFNHPLKLYIKMYNNTPRIFGKPFVSDERFKMTFKNYDLVFKVIQNNSDIPIYSINGKDPFDYITEYGNEYVRLKNSQATFIYKYILFNNNISFYDLPLSIEELTNFTVVYDNNETFITDFIVYSPFYFSKTDNNIFLNNINQNYIQNEKEIKFKTNKLDENDSEIINWNYNYNNIFKCRVDDKNEVNVYYIKQFGDSEDIDPFIQVIINCMEIFDNNTYPIILINSFNPRR